MDSLSFVQGDTGPNPVFHLKTNSPTAGATHRQLGSVASAFVRFNQAVSSPATVYLLPATVGASPGFGIVTAFIGSVANALATGGRYEAQVVLRGPWGIETWPRDEPFQVTVIDRNGSL